MSDDGREPDYGPRSRSPARSFSAWIAYHPWFEADLSRPYIGWMELNEQNATAGRSQNLSATLPVRWLVGWVAPVDLGAVPLPLDTGTKEKPGFWTRRRAFEQVRRDSNIHLLPTL